MPAARRIKPTDLFTEAEWAHLRRRSDLLGIGILVHAWTIIAAAMALAIWQPWLIPVAIPIIGARQLGLAIIMHEAAHGGLHQKSKINDTLGQWFAAAPIGASLHAYRPYHLTHHKYAQQAEDPDLALSAPFPITKASFRRKIIRDLTGQTFLKQRFNLFAAAIGLGAKVGKGAENRTMAAREAVLPFLFANAALLIVLILLGAWWAYFVLWLAPLATWNQLVTRIRNIAEHAVVTDNEDPLRHARTTRTAWWERLLIAPYWVNYHCEHHMFMHLPCYRLGEAHRLLTKKGSTRHMEVKTGYAEVLREAVSLPETASA
ncbi:MAG: fatty acid desaturase family protein [Pseudomonadota bacterium]